RPWWVSRNGSRFAFQKRGLCEGPAGVPLAKIHSYANDIKSAGIVKAGVSGLRIGEWFHAIVTPLEVDVAGHLVKFLRPVATAAFYLSPR
ncbi:hypothetical protein, partial [Mesorhizobium sp.]|uniref:hypothetical protein n=1 Tax=Mesorhizobium sp. TaxID=1871066 RepID=UPI00260034E6